MTRRQTKTEVSMFPFLSVLCTVIGVLVLFVVLVLSTRVVEEEERYRATAEHQRKLKAGRPDEVIEQGIEPATYRELEAELERLSAALEQRKRHRDELMTKLTSLEDLLDFKKTELLVPVVIKRGRELNTRDPVDVIPDTQFQTRLEPLLVEVSAREYTIHPGKQTFPVVTSRENDQESSFDASPELKQFLRSVQSRKDKQYLVFLVHPNGVEAFQNIRQYLVIKHQEIQIGWEPFSRQWVVMQNKAAE